MLNSCQILFHPVSMAAGPESDPAGGEFVQNVDPSQEFSRRPFHLCCITASVGGQNFLVVWSSTKQLGRQSQNDTYTRVNAQQCSLFNI